MPKPIKHTSNAVPESAPVIHNTISVGGEVLGFLVGPLILCYPIHAPNDLPALLDRHVGNTEPRL